MMQCGQSSDDENERFWEKKENSPPREKGKFVNKFFNPKFSANSKQSPKEVLKNPRERFFPRRFWSSGKKNILRKFDSNKENLCVQKFD